MFVPLLSYEVQTAYCIVGSQAKWLFSQDFTKSVITQSRNNFIILKMDDY